MTKLGGLRGRGGPVGPCFVRGGFMEWKSLLLGVVGLIWLVVYVLAVVALLERMR